MNKQITRVAVVALALLVALVVGTTYWQTWAPAGLADRQDNAIERVAQFEVERGLIYSASKSKLLAANKRKRVRGQTLYFRRYPSNGLFAQLVGYSTQARSQTGLERSMNDYLTGSNTNLNSVLRTTLDKLKGTTVTGNDLVLTVNPYAQKIALAGLGARCGAVVALEPSTGKVLVMASTPTYNPNAIESSRGYARILRTRAPCPSPAPLLNRGTAGLFTPGSTFKMVTAAAALDTGVFTPDSRFDDPGYCIEYGKRVSNAGNPEAPESFGNVDLVQGFEHSINSVFCNIGKRLGAGTILEYAKRFGFYSIPPLETPTEERAASGLYYNGKLVYPKHPNTQVDPGRLAFGQEHMLATPIQMAMVAGGIANGGVVMRPYVVSKVLSPGGSIVTSGKPDQLGRAIKPQTAAELTQMMVAAVQSGTGTAAQIPGVQVAGKTGTAETGIPGVNTTWFVCFAPANAPRVAVAVVLERQHGFGGTVAAPIAKDVLMSLLHVKKGP
jgi:peptidoglycan glycosyltransferase